MSRFVLTDPQSGRIAYSTGCSFMFSSGGPPDNENKVREYETRIKSMVKDSQWERHNAERRIAAIQRQSEEAIKKAAQKNYAVGTAVIGMMNFPDEFIEACADNDELSANVICPITQQVMQDPVIACDGNTYDRLAIMQWFEHKQCSPVTNEPIGQFLLPNLNIRRLIQDRFEAWSSLSRNKDKDDKGDGAKMNTT